MLNVSYKNKIGYFTLGRGKGKIRIDICHANCLCAMMYFYKDENGKNYTLAAFGREFLKFARRNGLKIKRDVVNNSLIIPIE